MKSKSEIEFLLKRYQEEYEETPPWSEDPEIYRIQMKAKIEALKWVLQRE